jgi:hypothetical protein
MFAGRILLLSILGSGQYPYMIMYAMFVGYLLIGRSIVGCQGQSLKAARAERSRPSAFRNLEKLRSQRLEILPDLKEYPLVNIQKTSKNYGKSRFLMGKNDYKWPCSIAMLNYQRVTPNLLDI